MTTITLNAEYLTKVALALTGKEIVLSLDVPTHCWGQAYKQRNGQYRINLAPRLLTTETAKLIYVFCHELGHIEKDNFDTPLGLDEQAHQEWILKNFDENALVELDTDIWAHQKSIWLTETLRRQGKTFLDMALIRSDE